MYAMLGSLALWSLCGCCDGVAAQGGVGGGVNHTSGATMTTARAGAGVADCGSAAGPGDSGACVPLSISSEALLSAFSDVFGVHDVLDAGFVGGASPLVAQALRQLDQLGVPRTILASPGPGAWDRNGTRALADWSEEALAGLLMRAALGNLVLGLRDPSDWSVLVADVGTGQLVRRRSFSAVRLAVIESLLLIAIVALGRAVWVYKS